MGNKDFAVFILTHGRPDNLKTLTTLKKCGYTGEIYFIVDNEDKTIEQYQKNPPAEDWTGVINKSSSQSTATFAQ